MQFSNRFIKILSLFCLTQYISCFINSISLDHHNSIKDNDQRSWNVNSLIDDQRKSFESFGVSAWFRIQQPLQNNGSLLSISTLQKEWPTQIQVVFDGRQIYVQQETNKDLYRERINIQQNNKWYLLVIIESTENFLQIKSYDNNDFNTIEIKYHKQSNNIIQYLLISQENSQQLITKDILFYYCQQKIMLENVINIASQVKDCEIINFFKRQLLLKNIYDYLKKEKSGQDQFNILNFPIKFKFCNLYIKIQYLFIIFVNSTEILRISQLKRLYTLLKIYLKQFKFSLNDLDENIYLIQKLLQSIFLIAKFKYLPFPLKLFHHILIFQNNFIYIQNFIKQLINKYLLKNRFHFERISFDCFKIDQYSKPLQPLIQKMMKSNVKSIISSFYLNDLDINSVKDETLFTLCNELSILITKINNEINLKVLMLNQQYNLGLIKILQNQITLQIEYQDKFEQRLIIQYYSNELLQNIINIDLLENLYNGENKVQQKSQHHDILITNLFIFTNFKLKQLTQKQQQFNQCILEANSITQNKIIQKACIFHSFPQESKYSVETPQINKNQKRNLSTIKYIHGSNMRSLVKKLEQNSELKYKIAQVQIIDSFMVIGYFKLTQSINKQLSLITIGVQSEYYNFLNLYIKDSSTAEIKYVHDTNNVIKYQIEYLSNFKDKWVSFGIVCSRLDQKVKFVYNSDSNSKIQSSTTISSAILPSTIANFDVCISCKIQGEIYDQFLGQVSSVKIIYDIDFDNINQYSFFNEAVSINQSSILSNSFDENNFVQNSEYDIGQGFECNQGFAFFEGVCIAEDNCKNKIFENDIYQSFEIGKFFGDSTKKCLNCGSNCLQCSSNIICTQCRSGYKIEQGQCIRCNDQNKCNDGCSGSQKFDPINQTCIDFFNTSSQILLNPLISSRIINDYTDIDVVPPFGQSKDIIIHCYLDVENNPITLHSFLGGIKFTSSILLKKQWSSVPKGYKKSVSFYVLFYGSGNPSNLQVKINSNIATLENNFETIVSNKISCSGSSSLTQSVFKVKFNILDYQTFFNLEISSNQNGWGIRNLNIEVLKCHPTCESCNSGGSESDCTSCKPGMIKNQFQCNCKDGKYAQYQNCFDSPCVTCSPCSVTNCQICEDITGNCTQCEAGYVIKDGQCIAESQCDTKNSKFFNYCGVSRDDAFIHFNQNKIVQYTEYWRFSQNNFTVEHFNSRNYLSLIGSGNEHSLKMALPDFQNYHYKVGLSIQILAHCSTDIEDYAQIYINNQLIFNEYYYDKPTWESSNLSKQKYFLTNTQSLYFRFVSITDQDLNDEGYSFTQLEFSYYRCHPMCKSCIADTLASCTNCIDNALKNINGDCQCSDGFYFSLVTQKTGSTPPGRCLMYGFTKNGNICQYNCQDGEYWDQTSQSCLNCHPCCKTCKSSSITDCYDCKPELTYSVQDKSCLSYKVQCQSCTIAANSLCGGNQSSHDKCIRKGWKVINSNTCMNCGKYVNNKCGGDQSQEVMNICLQLNLFIFEDQCLSKCPNGQIIKENKCTPCEEEQMPVCVNCYKTCLTCQKFEANIPDSCAKCSSLTREYDNGQCLCIDRDDDRQIFYECSYKNIAVLNAILSNTDSVLTIDFGKPLVIPNSYQENVFSKELCEYLFKEQIIELLGSVSKCSIQNKSIIVDLVENAKVFHGDFIYFKQNILKFQKTPLIGIDKYMNNVVIQDQINGNSKVQFNWVSIENSCNDIYVEFNQIINGAKRGFKNFFWSVKSFIPENATLQQAIQILLNKANTQQSSNLLIPKGFINVGQKVIIQFNYTLKANVQGFEDIPLSVKSEKKILIDVQTSNIFPLLRYQSAFFIISTSVKMCDPSGDLIIQEPIDFSMTSVEHSNINYINPGFNQKDYSIELKSYSFPASNIILNIHAKLLSNLFIESQVDYTIYSQQTDLFVQINGGDSYFNYKKDAVIEGLVRDLDIENENDPQGINISWQCIDPSTKQTCKSKLGNDVTFPSQQITATLKAFTFNPYTAIKIILIGDKPINRQSTNSVMVLLSELDLPPLGVDINMVDPKEKTVNLNEEIFVVLNYSSSVNVDLLSFSGTIQYENEVVGIIKFDYTTLRFQIWNYYNNFKRDQKEFQIRFNVFNPKYYMPSMYLKTLILNFPPNKCKFTVSPTTGGFSLETLFMVVYENCEDENQPISYQFFFYKDDKDFENEKKYPHQVLRRQISDKQKNSIIFTSLPAGKILILVQAIDSKNAIYNTTIAVTVERKQYNEQSYLSLIQQKLDRVSKVSVSDSISDLSQLCDDILQRPEFEKSASLNEKKIQIVNSLNTLQKNLSVLSSFSTIVDKAIKSLVESGIIYTQSQQTGLLNELMNTLEESSTLKDSYLELSKEKLKQKLFDSFQVINSMGLPSSNQESESKYLELSDKIGQNLFKNILPNENPINFSGDNLNIFASQMTEKYICDYFLCENNQNESDDSKLPNIYNFKKSQYNENPYSQDVSFQNYTNELKKASPNLELVNYPVINPSISTEQNVQISTLPQEIIINFPNKEKNNQQKSKACLSKDSNNKWTKSGCKNLYNEKYNTFKCICKELSPTTIMDDLEGLLTNSNIGTAFSQDGLSNIANFDEFYKYVAFWVLLFQTVSIYFFYNKGKKLDQIQQKQIGNQAQIVIKELQPDQVAKNKVVPLNNNNKNDEEKQSINSNQERNDILQKKIIQEDLIQSQQTQNDDNFFQQFTRLIDDKCLSRQEENINSINNNGQKDTQQKYETAQTQMQSNTNSPQIKLLQNFEDNEFQKQSNENEMNFITSKDSQFILNSPQIYHHLENAKSHNKNQTLIQSQFSTNNKKSTPFTMPNNPGEDNPEINQTSLKDNNLEKIQGDVKENKYDNNKKQDQKYLVSLQNYQNSFKKLSKVKQILIFHNFFGIFLLYNPDIPRALRILVFYIRSIHSLAISVVFDKQYSTVQKIAVAIINSITVMIIIKVLSKVFTMKSKKGIIMSRILILVVLAGYYYIILSIISGETPSESNSMIGTFFLIFFVDIFGISFISAFCQNMIANLIFKKEMINGIFKIFYKLIELQLVLLQLK